jgi:leader peptidase (prepilin peptidase)/N-methyltransferase
MAILDLFQTSPFFFIFTSTLFGLIVGSFLNVVIHRLPKMLEQAWQSQCQELAGQPPAPAEPYNLIVPRSACPHCGHKITALENIPLVSYLVLRGRCSGCGAKISLRYPMVELMAGLAGGFIAYHYGFGITAVSAIIFAWALIALTFIDLDTQLLPDNITLPLLWLGLALNLGQTFVPLPDAVIGAMAGYLSLWAVYWAFKLITGKEGMGYGDFKLLAAIGAWLGWKMLPVVILLSSMVGATVGILLIVLARHGRNIPIPFGPYLAGGGFIALIWGESLIKAYLGTFS